jgi:chromate reductase
MPPAVPVLGLCGSLRAASYNGWLLRAAVGSAPPGLAITIHGLAGIPVYDADVAADRDPAPVAALRGAIASTSAVLIASPEYNYGIPGGLKNAIDWVSRPAGRSPLHRKPVAIMGASTGPSGTMRMQVQLRSTLQSLDMYAMPKPEMVVTRCEEKFDHDGRLTDPSTREHLDAFLAAFAQWIRRF